MKHLVLLAALSMAFGVQAQKKTEGDSGNNTKKTTIADKTKSCKRFNGLFNLYQDTLTGSAFMEIQKTQVGKEYIYFCYAENGLVEAGTNRGSFRDNKVFQIRRYFDRIEFVQPNIRFRFDSTNAISKAADANISESVLLSLKIQAEDSTGTMLVDANSIYFSEGIHQIRPNLPPSMAAFFFNPGNMSKEKCKYASFKNYPMNTDVVVDYVFDNGSPSVSGSDAVTDPRSVTLRLQHSFIEVPQNDFVPRRDDARVGYFTTEFDDQTATGVTPWLDVIHRWDLRKKDPNAPMSEPIQPIVWWIEKTTPVEFRQTIKDAALSWNLAFEPLGFKNAVQVFEQADTATWDAGDIRYNVLRWTSSPNPPFGGYGPSFVNPRTGQILGADIMLEWVFVTNRLKQDRVFSTAGLDMYDEQQTTPNKNFCDVGEHMHQSYLTGLTSLLASGASDVDVQQYIKEALYYLILHEMGHTMGLNHNMKASQMLPLNQLNNKEITAKIGLTASVMDYPAVNLTMDPKQQGQYFTTRPGPYDLWAIEYGYSIGLKDPIQEENRLSKILDRSTDSLLIFGNDADDMRSPGNGIDPRVNIDDMSKDVLSYSIERFKIANNLMGKIKTKFSKPGQSYAELRTSYLILTSEMNRAATVTSRYIGGIYLDRGFNKQPGSTQPFTPVSLSDQKKAMDILSKYVFSPKAFDTPTDLYNFLQQLRRGFGFFGMPEDPKIHDRVLNMQRGILSQLLHPTTTKRITDSRLYGNKYALSDMMTDLTNAIFKEDLAGNVNTFRQNLQVEYVNRLIGMCSDKSFYDLISQKEAYTQLRNIQKMLSAPQVGSNGETNNHRSFIVYKIKSALDK